LGAHLPYPLLWAHEAAEAPGKPSAFAELATIAELPAWVDAIG